MASREAEPDRIDLSALEPLAIRASLGDDAAWKELVAALWPVLRKIIRQSSSMAALRTSDDHVDNVLMAVVEKLGREESRGLRLYRSWRESHEDKGFGDWIRIVTANSARDYAREQGGDASTHAADVSVKRLLNEFGASRPLEELGHRPPFTAEQTARQILEFAAERLDLEQHRALTLWLDGATFEEIAQDLRLHDQEAARRIVRSAVALLRREFSAATTG